MEVIATKLPKLESLWISLHAGDTRQLGHSSKSFHNLKTLVILNSFLNYKCPGFDPCQAAKHMSSLLNRSVYFYIADDKSLNGSPNEEQRAYGQKYTKFIAQFRELMKLSIDIRAYERGWQINRASIEVA
jgi:hypothetical protein